MAAAQMADWRNSQYAANYNMFTSSFGAPTSVQDGYFDTANYPLIPSGASPVTNKQVPTVIKDEKQRCATTTPTGISSSSVENSWNGGNKGPVATAVTNVPTTAAEQWNQLNFAMMHNEHGYNDMFTMQQQYAAAGAGTNKYWT